MDIKHAEKDADPLPATYGSGDGDRLRYKSVAGGDNQTLAHGNWPFWIAEKPEKECRKQQGDHRPDPPMRGPRQHCSYRQEA